MLYAKPLWKYAIDVYSENKAEFLHYQDQDQLCVNDLIVLGFCYRLSLAPNDRWWAAENALYLRDIIVHLRRLRNQPTNANTRKIILNTELECEKVDLQYIASQLRPHQNWTLLFNQYCEAHYVHNKRLLEQFIQNLGNKKGAEAP